MLKRSALFSIIALTTFFSSCETTQQEQIENNLSPNAETIVIDESGFVLDEGMELVITNCTPCHSAKLVTQNRANKEGWDHMITWMQETQNLWDLGENRETIIEYLARNYSPTKTGRRAQLTEIEWYDLQ